MMKFSLVTMVPCLSRSSWEMDDRAGVSHGWKAIVWGVRAGPMTLQGSGRERLMTFRGTIVYVDRHVASWCMHAAKSV